MSLFHKIRAFLSNGASVFRLAASGNYSYYSSEIEEWRKEISDDSLSPEKRDKRNLLQDKKQIGSDMRKAYNKIDMNGKTTVGAKGDPH